MKLLRPNSETHWYVLAVLSAGGLLAAFVIWWSFQGDRIEREDNLAISPLVSLAISPSVSSFPVEYAALKGKVKFTDLEGGCWFLSEEGGKNYQLYGIEKEQLESYRDKNVEVRGKIRNDVVSICMIGEIFEVKAIRFE